ncbi:signal recognition particle-docking protein FtsY [Peptoniphilus harei]|uniref:signal recognition particle-docking protein FtsY n=1 Tax=Peptoniphilus harei TaxID=54005 RepID=UPI00254CEFB4|nr:signal recognition particle-docking protein FtsY [Peptoniphilus harei]MDK7355084.1 signal recognition particle-docking protein FtsY [Peptoniphilus harei]MDK7370804.1 signal recognition particle-docking protein FtsY [Peptoniphilus harei]
MFNWFKDKFKKKEDKENKEELIEENLSEEVESKEEADEENILTNEEIREEEAQEIEEIHEKLEEVSEGGNLSEEDVNTSEKIQDTNEAFNDKSVIEDALEKKEAAREEAQAQEIEEIHEKLEEVSEEGKLSEEDVETSEKIKDTNEAFKDKEVIEDALEQKEEAQEEIKEVENTEEVVEEEPKKVSLFQRLKEGLDKTRKEVGIKINTVLGAYVKIDDEMLEDLEDILISADIGMETTMKLIDNLRETIIREKINDPQEVKPLLMAEAKKLMNPELNTPINTEPPVIILVVGVNGVGKTTTIGKLSSRFKREGKSVLVCAADTFRAAAIDQLKEWGNRAHVDIISHAEGSDPAAVVFDAIEAAKARKTDVLIVDTAGRLHNKSNLMKELEKINRIISNKFPEANRENLLVLDSTTGQNAINQAKTFREATDITGIALTKLDGTAKGGVVVALQSELGIPIKLIGVGEGIDDLQDFNIDNFLETIFG